MNEIEDRLQKQRFELKYRITEELAQQAREFVSCYLDIDENGRRAANLSYPVHSLYLDSDHLITYWRTINGDKNRFKLRFRFYNADPETPVFCEIKRRVDNCIFKERGRAHKALVPQLLAGQLPALEDPLSLDPWQLRAIERFCELAQVLQAWPKMHVAYQREAWLDRGSGAVRVTFDRDVLGEAEPTTGFRTEMTNPCRPFGNNVILELKFTDRFPNWLREMVERFELSRWSAAKYCQCVEMIGGGGLRRSSGLLPTSHLQKAGTVHFPKCPSTEVQKSNRADVRGDGETELKPKFIVNGNGALRPSAATIMKGKVWHATSL